MQQLEIYSRCYGEQPLVIQGAGAGNDTTAAGVLADILDLQDLFPWNAFSIHHRAKKPDARFQLVLLDFRMYFISSRVHSVRI